MKRITLMLLATFFAVAGFSQKPLAKAETFANTTNDSTLAFDFYAICFSIKYGSKSTFRCLFPLMADSINSS